MVEHWPNKPTVEGSIPSFSIFFLKINNLLIFKNYISINEILLLSTNFLYSIIIKSIIKKALFIFSKIKEI